MVDIPCFKSFRASLDLPKNNGGGSSPIDLALRSSTDKALGAPSPAPGTGTPLFYEAVRASFQLVLDGPAVTANFSSVRSISPTHTYAVDVFRNGRNVIPTITGLVPSGHNLSVNVTLPHATFEAGTVVQIVLYESS